VPETDVKQVIRFGTFEVDPRAGELRRNGSRVKLQDQPFQVLLALLGKPGEVVTREELQAKLWPADTFVDFDHGLNAAVKRLRDALGDTAENPRFIETLADGGIDFLFRSKARRFHQARQSQRQSFSPPPPFRRRNDVHW